MSDGNFTQQGYLFLELYRGLRREFQSAEFFIRRKILSKLGK